MTISAKIIADSIGEHSPRLTTLQLRYPKFIHGEFMTHRVFSRNASSSRAIPVERLIKDVIEDPLYPSHWGANQKGMQAREENTADVLYGDERCWLPYSRDEAWDKARNDAVTHARAFSNAGYHKQIINRLLEPFCHINVVVTATEWSNFFALRCHKDAQPEMRLLAEAIKEAMAGSTPEELGPSMWHLPYVDNDTFEKVSLHMAANFKATDVMNDFLIKLSVARCARVSYLTQEGKVPSIDEDLALYERLAGSMPLHASPMEHQATPDKTYRIGDGIAIIERRWEYPELHGNLRGWIQFRKTLPNECR